MRFFFGFFSGLFSACSIHAGPCARRPNVRLGQGCTGARFLLKHERLSGLGMMHWCRMLLTNAVIVWAWMLWSAGALGALTFLLLWLVYRSNMRRSMPGGSGNGVSVRPCEPAPFGERSAVPVCRCIGANVRRGTGASVYRCIGANVCRSGPGRSTSVSVYRCVRAPFGAWDRCIGVTRARAIRGRAFGARGAVPVYRCIGACVRRSGHGTGVSV